MLNYAVQLTALVDIGAENVDLHFLRLINVNGGFRHIAEHGCQQRSEIFAGVVRFQICGTVGCICVSGRMAFVEGICRKRGHGIENFGCDLFGNTCGDRTVTDLVAVLVLFTEDESMAFIFHFLRLLFGHGTADDVRSSVRKSRDITADVHDLLLIQDASGGFVQYLFELGCAVADLFGVCTVFKEFRDRIHRTGTVDGDGEDNILQTEGAHGGEHFSHTARFELENAVGSARGDQFIGLFIIKGYAAEIEIRFTETDLLFRIGHDREIAES